VVEKHPCASQIPNARVISDYNHAALCEEQLSPPRVGLFATALEKIRGLSALNN